MPMSPGHWADIAFDEGAQAFPGGEPPSSNPYECGSECHDMWDEGWHFARQLDQLDQLKEIL
jgi:hypothetical protein